MRICSLVVSMEVYIGSFPADFTVCTPSKNYAFLVYNRVSLFISSDSGQFTVKILHNINTSRASRGIGLQIVKQLSANAENIVVASCRNPEGAQELAALQSSVAGKVHIVKLEVNDEESIKSAAAETSKILGDQGLDYLLNNAAIVSAFL